MSEVQKLQKELDKMSAEFKKTIKDNSVECDAPELNKGYKYNSKKIIRQW